MVRNETRQWIGWSARGRTWQKQARRGKTRDIFSETIESGSWAGLTFVCDRDYMTAEASLGVVCLLLSRLGDEETGMAPRVVLLMSRATASLTVRALSRAFWRVRKEIRHDRQDRAREKRSEEKDPERILSDQTGWQRGANTSEHHDVDELKRRGEFLRSSVGRRTATVRSSDHPIVPISDDIPTST